MWWKQSGCLSHCPGGAIVPRDLYVPPTCWRGHCNIARCCTPYGPKDRRSGHTLVMIGEPPVADFGFNPWCSLTWCAHHGSTNTLVGVCYPKPQRSLSANMPKHTYWHYLGLSYFLINQEHSFVLFAFTSDLKEVVTFSWGNAILACQYHELCYATPANSNQVASPLTSYMLV